MNQSNPFLNNIRESSGMRIAVLFGSFFIMLLFTQIIGVFIEKFPIGTRRDHILATSAIQCIFAFCIPAVMLAKFAGGKWERWLYLTKFPTIKSFIGVLIIYIISLPALEWLIEWNSGLHLPVSMQGIEEKLREWESNATATTDLLLHIHDVWSVIIGVLIIGLLTSFSEELFFRGGFQGILTRTPMNKDLAVWLSAILFSVMHFQFFGFVPRLLMGAFFGYLLIWSRSLWLPVFAHIINNSAVVITASLTDNQATSISELGNTEDIFNNSLVVAASIVLTVSFIWICRGLFKTDKSVYTWQKSQLPPITEK